MSYDNPQSRNEAILQNILGADNVLEPPQSRTEAALTAILNGEEYTGEAKSRVEMLLKEISQQGGGGDVDVEALNVTENGTYTAPEGTAYSPVTVDVEPDLMAKSVTENGTYQAASDNVDGYSAVTVDVEANVGTKSITQNGTYTAASEQLDGYSEVTVNVSGGGGQEVPEKDVNFIDYDGTVLYSYTAQEALALTALPANPSHEGLTAQGWNYTLAEVKTEVNAVGGATVGQMYVTDDGKTRLYVDFPDDAPVNRLKYIVNFKSSASNNTVIDWGDGTSERVGSTSATNYSHTYAVGGKYVISLAVDSGTTIDFTTYINGPSAPIYMPTKLTKMHVGTGVKTIQGAFNGAIGLEYITMPNTTKVTNSRTFTGCYALKSITISTATPSLPSNTFSACYSLKSVSIPPTVEFIGEKAFGDCFALSGVHIPSSVTDLSSSEILSKSYALSKIAISANVPTIGGVCFSNSGIGEYHFKRETPPSISSNTFYNMISDTVIYVPAASLETYKTATNWSSYASKMVGE